MAQRLSDVWLRTYNLCAPAARLDGTRITLVTSTESPEVKAVNAVPRPTPGSVSMKNSIFATGPELAAVAG